MSRTTVLSRGQAAAEAGMVDTCTIRRSTGTTTDPFSGEIVDTYDDLYEGKCRFQQANAARADHRDAGQAYLLLQQVEIQLPVSVTGIKVDDEITCTASRDLDVVSRIFQVRDLMVKTDATARRLQITEVTS